MPDARKLALLAIAGSAALLLGAFYFQYVRGLAPCQMCIWQRWPHGIAIAFGLVWLARPRRELLVLAGLVVLAGAGIGLYHAGVEQHWWQGPSTCTGASIEGLTPEELLNQIVSTPVVRCDAIVWSLFGLTMAAWNAIFSLVLSDLWFLAALRSRREAAGHASSSASQ